MNTIKQNIEKNISSPGEKPHNVYDYLVVFSMALVSFALVPLVVRIARTQSAKDISYATPIMFTLAFVILTFVSAIKKLYLAFFIFIIGLVISIILLVQKIMYEKNSSNYIDGDSQEDIEIEDYPTKFSFPDPELAGIQKAKFKN